MLLWCTKCNNRQPDHQGSLYNTPFTTQMSPPAESTYCCAGMLGKNILTVINWGRNDNYPASLHETLSVVVLNGVHELPLCVPWNWHRLTWACWPTVLGSFSTLNILWRLLTGVDRLTGLVVCGSLTHWAVTVFMMCVQPISQYNVHDSAVAFHWQPVA